MVVEAAPQEMSSDFPLQYDVEYPESLSRLLIFVKWLLAIPHMIVLYALGIVLSIITLIAFFTILFTRQYPRGMFDLVVNINRWNANLGAYVLLLRDEYPPFSWEPGQYAVTYELEHPENLNRWLPLIKWLLAIPHFIVIVILAIISYFVLFIAWFAILFTGKFPRGMFDYVVGVSRWSYRVNAYIYLQRDEYPPFSLK
jgi:hypothetical protein